VRCALGPWGIALAVAVASGTGSRPAGAQVDPKTCGAAYVKAQVLRRESHLRASRSQLLVCSNPSCAASLRGDCVKWLSEVEGMLPTVVFSVKGGDDRDLTAVKVTVDGDLLVDDVGGAAVAVDPGPHTFRFTTYGAAPVEVQALIHEGEQAKTIQARFAKPAGSEPGPGLLPYIVGGGALVLLGIGSAFEISGLSDKGAADSCAAAPRSCSPATYDADKGAAERGFVAGDVFIGLGLVGAAGAAYFYFKGRPSKQDQAGALPVLVSPRGLALQVRF